MIAAKGEERALGGADVGVIDVPVDDIRAVILRMHPLGYGVRPLAQVVHGGVVIKLQSLGRVSRLAGNDRINVKRKLAHRMGKFMRLMRQVLLAFT